MNLRTLQVLAAAAALAFGLAAPNESNAQVVGYECILDTEDGGTSMNTADTDQGASANNTASNLACGTSAMAGAGGENTAVGSGAMAGIGAGSSENTASGEGAQAGVGAGSNVNSAYGASSSAGVGDGSSFNTALGQNADAGVGNDSGENTAVGYGSVAGRGINSDDNTALGDDTSAGVGNDSNENTALGEGASAGIGDESNRNTAVGQSAAAGMGSGINDATAVGGAATANFAGSTALGAGATTMRANQMVYGTATETHTMPGITSDESRAEQSGKLELVTTDASGNLASDQGDTFGRIRGNKNDINDNSEGIAMALSLQDPDLTGDERLGLKIGWGTFSGENAMGVTVAGVVMPDIGAGIRLGLAGGAAFGLSEGNVGGRAGVQLSW